MKEGIAPDKARHHALMLTDQPCRLELAMLRMFTALRQKSRLRKNTVAFVEATFRRLVHGIATEIEAIRDEAKWVETSGIAMEPLRRAGSSRTRRVSSTYRIAVNTSVFDEVGIRTLAAFLAAQRIIAGGFGRRGKKGPAARTGERYLISHQKQYMMASHRAFQNAKHAFVSTDASRVAALDLLVFAHGDPHTGLAGWSPPQVLPSELVYLVSRV